MRSLMLAFTMLAGLAVVPALAQNANYPPPQNYPPQGYTGPVQGQAPGMMMNQGNVPLAELPAPPSHQPMVRHPTNLNQSDTRSVISPSLPQPDVGVNADATAYLRAAMRALERHELGEAQSALENAETWLLNRSVPMGQVNQPDTRPAVQNIQAALNALSTHNVAQTMSLVRQTIPMARADEQGVMMGGPQAAMNGAYGQPPMANYGRAPMPPPNAYAAPPPNAYAAPPPNAYAAPPPNAYAAPPPSYGQPTQ